MQKVRIEYDSPVDALVSVAKRLNGFESRYRLTSEGRIPRFLQAGIRGR
jgi:hypothetical protein